MSRYTTRKNVVFLHVGNTGDSINPDQSAEMVSNKQHTNARTLLYVRLCFHLIFQFVMVCIALALARGGYYEIQSARFIFLVLALFFSWRQFLIFPS